MRQGTVIEYRYWLRDDGRRASLGAACPWIGPEDKARWKVVTSGYTIRWSDGTTGCGRPPFATREQAELFLSR